VMRVAQAGDDTPASRSPAARETPLDSPCEEVCKPVNSEPGSQLHVVVLAAGASGSGGPHPVRVTPVGAEPSPTGGKGG